MRVENEKVADSVLRLLVTLLGLDSILWDNIILLFDLSYGGEEDLRFLGAVEEHPVVLPDGQQ